MTEETLTCPSELRTLYLDHYGWLKRWLHRKLRDLHDAEDIAQDTFVRLMSRRCSVLTGEPRAFLAHIANCLVIDKWRRQEIEQAYLQVLALMPEATEPSAEHRWQTLEALYQIDAMLRQLPELTRTIFLMSQLDGLTYQVIADTLGVSLPTVKRHMSQAFLACLQFESE